MPGLLIGGTWMVSGEVTQWLCTSTMLLLAIQYVADLSHEMLSGERFLD